MSVILFNYPWAMDFPGGGERQLHAYAKHLGRFGVKASLYDMWNPRLDAYQILHCFSVMPGTIEMCQYAKNKGLKLVVSPNLWVTEATVKDYPHEYIWNMLEIADRIVVNSNMEGDKLSQVFAMPREKFHTVLNAADTDFVVPVDPEIFKKEFGITEKFVLNVANIEPRKNQLPFLTALQEQRPDLLFVVIGHIRDQHFADACAQVAGGKLRIIDGLPYASEMIRSAMTGCEFFAMPSLLETPSIAAIEAAAIGARVLLTSSGSTTEYFGDTVTYVNPWLHSSLCEGISDVMTLPTARLTWRVHNSLLWPKIIPQLVSCYRSLVDC
jgi:glycosyltransferase involved in cell wall biosynthesis